MPRAHRPWPALGAPGHQAHVRWVGDGRETIGDTLALTMRSICAVVVPVPNENGPFEVIFFQFDSRPSKAGVKLSSERRSNGT